MINTDHTLKLLQASIDMIEKDKEIDRLNDIVKLREAEIAILQCKLQRATVPFNKRPDQGRERMDQDLRNAGRGHLVGP